ncbi:Acetyltransferase (GNAT) family protein [Oceanobacillus limi]|uniref:Acetyltransferase (GNAT) family protein n=1 Tax=Oceanobacillus limi TaxID=930131 RepID=A0A1I0G9K4_9BACI|nr:Acetyltransferase (GNAT) family protein [Oceanobacillus limi]
MSIRKATFKETQYILDQALVVLKDSSMGFVQPSIEKASQIMTPILADGGYYLVFETNQIIHGWIGVGTIYDFYTDETVGTIPEIYVFPTYRKQGIAEKLMREAFRYLAREGVRKVQLNVFAGNKAKKLYEKLGFHDVSTLMEKNLMND